MKKYLVIPVLLLLQLSLPAQSNPDQCFYCLLGAKMHDPAAEYLLNTHDFEQGSARPKTFTYSTSNGEIVEISIPASKVLAQLVQDIGYDTEYKRTADKVSGLKAAHKINTETVLLETDWGNMHFALHYTWNNIESKHYKDFYLSYMVITWKNKAALPLAMCSDYFRGPDKCYSGNCLGCLVGKKITAAEHLINLFNLKQPWDKKDVYGDLETDPMQIKLRGKYIEQIVINPAKYTMELPLDIQPAEKIETLKKRLNIYPYKEGLDSTAVYYYDRYNTNARVAIHYNSDLTAMKDVTLHDASSLTPGPSCDLIKKGGVDKAGCLSGDCKSGYGRKVFNDLRQYEGYFKDGLPNGDGCLITDDTYEHHAFGHFSNGRITGPLQKRLCVDEYCMEAGESGALPLPDVYEGDIYFQSDVSDLNVFDPEYGNKTTPDEATLNEMIKDYTDKLESNGMDIISMSDLNSGDNRVWHNTLFSAEPGFVYSVSLLIPIRCTSISCYVKDNMAQTYKTLTKDDAIGYIVYNFKPFNKTVHDLYFKIDANKSHLPVKFIVARKK